MTEDSGVSLLAQILLTIVTLGYSLVPAIVDLNATHAKNPRWTPHARFHVVWQVGTYVGIGVLALALIWWPGAHGSERLVLVWLLAAAVYASFFVAVFAMPVYEGMTYDDNAYPPFKVPLAGRIVPVDMNIATFTVIVVILIAAGIVL